MSEVQTEGTNLAVVEESAFNAFTPPTTRWRNLQPNTYGNFGSTIKKTPRDPISKNLQLRKGMLTDLDSMVPFEHDITKDLFDRFGEGIFRSATKHSGGTGQSLFQIEAVTSTGFQVAALGGLGARTLVMVRGCPTEANNGLHLVGAGSTGTEIKVAGLTAEAIPSGVNATAEVAGFRFDTTDLSLNADGNLVTIAKDCTQLGLTEDQWLVVGGRQDDAVYSFATPEFHGAVRVQAAAAHLITLDRRTWDNDSRAKLDLSTVAANLDTVVEAQTPGVAGNSITVRSLADGNPAVKASLDMDAAGNSAHINTLVQAKIAGTAGNLITVEVTTGAPTAAGVLTEVGTHVKLQIKITATATTVANLETLIGTSTLIEVKTPGTGATSLDATDAFDSVPLTGGLAADAPSVTEVGSAVTLHYTPGATTVAQMEAAILADSALIQTLTAGTQSNVLADPGDVFVATNLAGGDAGTDLGTGKTVEVYFSRFWRNVPIDHDDYRTPSFAFEVTYPELDAGEPEYEYALGNMLDEAVWNFPLTGKATMNLSFVGCRTRRPTSDRLDGPADALDPNTDAGVSTSTDLQRLRISEADETGITSDLTSLKITTKNNVSAQKQLAKLGPRLLNQGKHTSMVDAEVIFTDASVITAVLDNTTSMLDILMRNEDFGALLDIQAMTLDTNDRKFEKDKIMSISTKGSAFQKPGGISTDSLSLFAYLPELAEAEQ